MKKIDYYLGLFLLIVLLPLIKVIYFIIKKIIPESIFKKRIIFLKLLGGGSLLIAYPSILAIKEKYPNYQLVLLCSKEVSEYAKILNLFDEIHVVYKFKIFFIISFYISSVRKYLFSHYICNLELHSRLCFVFANLLLPRILISLNSNVREIENHFSNRKIFYNPHTPIYEGYNSIAHLLKAFDINAEFAKQRFQDLHAISVGNQDFSIMGVAPFCSPMYKERQFSLVELGAILSQQIMPHIREIRLYGGANDIVDSKNYCVYLSKLLNINVKNCSGIFNLSQMVTEINSIGSLITIDSGINHIARLTNVRVISYWGPSDPNLRLRNILPNESIIYHKLPCSPCVHLMDQTPCNGNNICLSQYLGNSTANILWLLK